MPERMHVVLGTGEQRELPPGRVRRLLPPRQAALPAEIAATPRRHLPAIRSTTAGSAAGPSAATPSASPTTTSASSPACAATRSLRLEQRRHHDARRPRRRRLRARPCRSMMPATFETLRHQARSRSPARDRRARYELLEPGGGPRLRAPPAALRGRPLLRHGGRPVLRRRARVPVRRDLGRATASRASTPSGRTTAPRRSARSSSSSTSSTSALERYPDLHVYHYAPYEPTALKRLMGLHGTREDELDELLRSERARRPLRGRAPGHADLPAELLDQEGRGLLHGRARPAVTDGGDSIVAYERWLETGEQRILDAIERYNEEDCLSTLKLRDWLLERRAEAEAQFGREIAWRADPRSASAPRSAAEAAETDGCGRLCSPACPTTRQTRPTSSARLAAGAAARLPPPRGTSRSGGRSSTAAGCRGGAGRATPRRSADLAMPASPARAPEADTSPLVYTLAFPPRSTSSRPGRRRRSRDRRRASARSLALDDAAGRRGSAAATARADEPAPARADPRRALPTRRAARGAAATRATSGRATAWTSPAATARCGTSSGARCRARTGSSRGRRSRASRVDLERAKRIALASTTATSSSRARPARARPDRRPPDRAPARARQAGRRHREQPQGDPQPARTRSSASPSGAASTFRGLKKSSGETAESRVRADELHRELRRQRRLRRSRDDRSWSPAPPGCSRARTWTRRSTTCSSTRRARSRSPTRSRSGRGAQPRPARRPAAARAGLAGRPPRRRRRLGARAPARRRRDDPARARRLPRPDLAHAPGRVRLHLRGRLRRPARARSRTARASGRGRRRADRHRAALPARRARGQHPPLARGGRGDRARWSRSCSAAAVHGRGRRDRAADARRHHGRRAVQRPGPVPARAAAATASRVGTVDKFQGQEAPVVFFSMATSSGDEIPRNLEFLFSRNRLNVAVSRAQCLAVLVASPELLDIRCRNGRADAAGERALPAGRDRRQSRLALLLCRDAWEIVTCHPAVASSTSECLRSSSGRRVTASAPSWRLVLAVLVCIPNVEDERDLRPCSTKLL